MGKYDIEYFRCPDCHFVQTEDPYWLDEAYGDAIVSTDVGLISRNERFARIADRVLRFVYPGADACLDYGGGYGMFTRMMRDRGHRFRHLDPYCDNLFAAGLDVTPDTTGFDLLTAFEVFEHFRDPHADLRKLDRTADHWLVSTEPVPEPPPQPGEWWYYVLDGGQHISLWSRKALQFVAAQYGRQLISYRGLHLFSRTKVNSWWARAVLRDRASRGLDSFRKRRSLLGEDFQSSVDEARRVA